MLPIVQLRHVTRDDVQRIAQWLQDDDVSSRWFGHYGCGDPVHRGYEPGLMLTGSTEDWVRVFDRDRGRLIFSIHSREEGHIGECQALFDGIGGVEMSLLIGRKDLWHRGFGAAAALQLLDRIFYDYPVEQVWVSVPQDNMAALRLFNGLGFSVISEESLCMSESGDSPKVAILALQAADYRDRKLQPRSGGRYAPPIVTVTGLPSSGSEHVAAETARLMRARFVDEQITEDLAIQLGRTVGEIASLEASYMSIWARLLRAALEPWERYGAIDGSTEYTGTLPRIDHIGPPDYLTKEEYLKGLKSVLSSTVANGTVILHGHGASGLVPNDRPTFHVFVDMGIGGRARKLHLEDQVPTARAHQLLQRVDKAFVSLHKRLFGLDSRNQGQYDIKINMDRLTVESAARIISGAVVRSANTQRARAASFQVT